MENPRAMSGPSGSVMLHTFPDSTAQATALAQAVACDLNACLAQDGRACLAVPGGTTPEAFLTFLATQSVPWNLVRLTLTDERCVPADHPRSNARLIEKTLLAHATGIHFTPLEEHADIAALIPLDVVVLGMGTDGHTASLFPRADNLEAALSADCPLHMKLCAPDTPEPRRTLTLRVLAEAKRLYILITGEDKYRTLEEVLRAGAIQDKPMRAILRAAKSPPAVYYTPDLPAPGAL